MQYPIFQNPIVSMDINMVVCVNDRSYDLF